MLGAEPASAEEYPIGTPGSPFSLAAYEPPLTLVDQAGDGVLVFDVPVAPPAAGVRAYAVTVPLECGQPALDKEFLWLRWRQSSGATAPMTIVYFWYRTDDSQGWQPVVSDPKTVGSDQDSTTWKRKLPGFLHGTALSLKIQFLTFNALPTPGRLEEVTIAFQKWVEPTEGPEDDPSDDSADDGNDKKTDDEQGPGVFVYPSDADSGSGGGGSGTGSGPGTGSGSGSGAGSGAGSSGVSASDLTEAPPATPAGSFGQTGFVPVDPSPAGGTSQMFVTGKAVSLSTTSLSESSEGGGSEAAGGAGDGPRMRVSRGHVLATAALGLAIAALVTLPGLVAARRQRGLRDYGPVEA